MRDIIDYEEKYLAPSFEHYKVQYRRKKIIEIISSFQPHNILEIGCGDDPLFQYLPDKNFTIVEPSEIFCKKAQQLSSKYRGVICIQDFFENVALKLSQTPPIGEGFDMIICASLLHEVDQPNKLLQAISYCCSESTMIHICVPNANSLHRILGYEMNIIEDLYAKTEKAKLFQQNHVYDMKQLIDIVTENGLQVIEKGSFFVKPFSHEQMLKMLENEIIDEKALDALYRMGKYLPDFGSEIYVNCKVENRGKTSE